MGQGALNYQGVKSGIKLNDVIEDFKYVYKGQEIKAGDLVNYINGIASKVDYGESVDTQLSTQTNSGYVISAVQLDENRVFVAHSYGSNNYLYGVVCEINGATITYGTDTQLSVEMYSGDNLQAIKLDGNRVFIVHRKGQTDNLTSGLVCEISGTTITKGTDTILISDVYACQAFSICLLPSGNIFIAYRYASNHYLHGMVVIISGTTITTGTDITLVRSTNAGTTISTCLLPNGNVFITHSYGSDYYLYGMIVSIDGTTITAGTDTAIVNTSSSYAGQQISTCLLADGNVFIAHRHTSAMYLYGIVCSINGTTITKGTDTAINSSVPHTDYGVSTVLLPNGNVFISHAQYIDTKHHLYGIICSVEGTKITVGADTPLNVSDNSTAWLTKSLLLSNGMIFTAYSYTENNYYLYAQIFGIDYENNIPTNNIVITEYETQVTPAIEPPFNAVALSSGVGAPEYVECDVLKEGNIIPTSWTYVSDTEYVSDTGVRLTSSTRYYTENLSNVCDGNIETYCRLGQSTTNWVKLKFPEPISIAEMYVYVDFSNSGYYFYLQVSDDDSTWTTLFTEDSEIKGNIETGLTSAQKYKFYRLLSYCPTANLFTPTEWQTTKYYARELVPSTEHNEQVKIARVYKEIEKEVTKTGNIFPTSWNEDIAYTKYSSDGWIIESSSSYGSTYATNLAFDGTLDGFWRPENGLSASIKITCPKPTKITKMKTCVQDNVESVAISVTIQGSHDNSQWVDLHTFTKRQTNLVKATLNNTDFYKYYQMVVTHASTSGELRVYEWQTSEYIEKVTEVIQ